MVIEYLKRFIVQILCFLHVRSVYARYNKAEGNDLDSYRRSWADCNVLSRESVIRVWQGLLTNHLNNKKNSRQHKKMQTRQESFHYKSDLLDKWEI